MGKYLIRSRITDNFQRTSDWSELNEMIIAPPPTKIISKAPDMKVPIFADKRTNIFTTTLKWNEIPSIDNYMIIAENPEGEKIHEYKTKATSLKVELVPGLYRFKVLAILDDGTLGEPSTLTEIYNILGAKILPPRLAFKKHKNGIEYVQIKSELKNAVIEGLLEYQFIESNIWLLDRKIVKAEIKDLEFNGNLKPGKYKLTLNALANGFSPSDSSILDFIIKPKLPDIQSIGNEIELDIHGPESSILNASENIKVIKK
jgi:hypothetical protein